MDILEGSIDPLGRPLIHLRSRMSSFVCIIDTGFNRSLLMSRRMARALDFVPYAGKIVDRIQTAGAIGDVCELMHGTVVWFGEDRSVVAHVVAHEPGGIFNGASIGLVGTEFLATQLMIDFAAKTVRIQKSP